MSFLKRLAGLLAAPAPASGRFYLVSVKCQRCGEVVEGRINLNNDLSLEDDGEGGAASTLVCRKVLLGKERCFQPLEVVLRFDSARRLLDKQVTGGTFVE